MYRANELRRIAAVLGAAPRAVSLVPLGVVATNAAILLTWQATYASDVPFDHMVMALSAARRFLEGDQGLFAHLFSPHNEHLIVTSRPLFLLDGWLAGGRGYLLVALNVMILVTLAAASALVAWFALAGQPGPPRLALAALAAGLWLNAHQLMNLNWGFQVAHFLTAALGFAIAVLLALVDSANDSTTARRLLIVVGVLIVLSALTMRAGLVAGPVALTVAVLLRWDWRRLVVLALPTAAVVAHYVTHVRIPDLAAGGRTPLDPLSIAQFVVLFMAGTFVRLTEWPSNFPFWLGFRPIGFAFGAVILAVAATAFLIRLRRPRWGGGVVTIGLACIGIALVVAILGAA